MSGQHSGRLARMACGCALACLLGVAAAGPASAEDDFFSSVMHGLGLRNGTESGIDYRERSPLVIPPKRELPAPERASVESNPAWPVDPEIKAKKESAELESTGNSSQAIEDNSRPLRPDQLTPGRKFSKKSNARGNGSVANNNPGDNESGRVLRPSELGSNSTLWGMFKGGPGTEDEIGKFTTEPPRASLTDPPSGYQTPSAAAPYGLGKDRTPIKPGDYQLEHGTRGD
jgi:hypothetical protein